MFSFEQKEDNFLVLHSLRFKYLWFSSFNNFRNTCRYLYSLFPNKLECSGETCAGGGGGLPAIQPVSNGGDRDTWWRRPGGAPDVPVVLRAASVRARDTWTDGTRHARRQVPPPHMGPCARGASANTTTASGAACRSSFFFLLSQVTSKRLRKKNAKNANLINLIRVHPCH